MKLTRNFLELSGIFNQINNAQESEAAALGVILEKLQTEHDDNIRKFVICLKELDIEDLKFSMIPTEWLTTFNHAKYEDYYSAWLKENYPKWV